MIFTEYITLPGDRWYLIAFKAYGTVDQVTLDDGTTCNAMSLIYNANPGIELDDILPNGLLLQIPILSLTTPQSSTNNALVPPWKR